MFSTFAQRKLFTFVHKRHFFFIRGDLSLFHGEDFSLCMEETFHFAWMTLYTLHSNENPIFLPQQRFSRGGSLLCACKIFHFRVWWKFYIATTMKDFWRWFFTLHNGKSGVWIVRKAKSHSIKTTFAIIFYYFRLQFFHACLYTSWELEIYNFLWQGYT